MSAIDTYWHEVIGQIDGIPVYRLKEKGPSNPQYIGFTGKKGDVLLGGGSGEASAMRLKLPEAIKWFTDKDDYMMKKDIDQIVTTYWSNNDAHEFIERYKKIGYNSKECPIETWLAEHLVAWLIKTFPEYQKYVGSMEEFNYHGEIVTDPRQEWVEFVEDWFKHRKEK